MEGVVGIYLVLWTSCLTCRTISCPDRQDKRGKGVSIDQWQWMIAMGKYSSFAYLTTCAISKFKGRKMYKPFRSTASCNEPHRGIEPGIHWSNYQNDKDYNQKVPNEIWNSRQKHSRSVQEANMATTACQCRYVSIFPGRVQLWMERVSQLNTWG